MPFPSIYALAMFLPLIWKNYGHFQPWKKTLPARENKMFLRANTFISKNMALIYHDFKAAFSFPILAFPMQTSIFMYMK